MVALGRPINGISINGCEWLLKDSGKLNLFSCTDEAVIFLQNHGLTDIDIEDYIFDENIEVDEM
jgi:hypothetical protein